MTTTQTRLLGSITGTPKIAISPTAEKPHKHCTKCSATLSLGVTPPEREDYSESTHCPNCSAPLQEIIPASSMPFGGPELEPTTA
jgi:hypothetical protein